MQGPVKVTDNASGSMVSPRSEKGFGKGSLNQEVHMRGESGTCNVCSAPCSSCMHLKRTLMESKTDDFSDETCRVNDYSQYSANEADALSSVKSRACDGLEHAVSETSYLFSVNSSLDSSFENADSKATVRSCGMTDSPEDGKMLRQSSSGGIAPEDYMFPESAQRIFLKKKDEFKDLEGHGDNISCISGSGNANIESGYSKGNVGRKNLSCSSPLLGSLLPEGFTEPLFPVKLELSENPVAEDVDARSSSLKARSPCFHSQSDKSLSSSAIAKDSDQDPSFQIKGKQPEICMEHIDLLTVEVASASVHGQISSVSRNGLSSEFSTNSKGEEAHKNCSEKPNGAMSSSDKNEQEKKSNELFESPDLQERPLQSVSGDESDESDTIEHDVKVCDICGDAGREDLLAICSRCTDGAEHTYCMREMLQKIPEDDWLCEECKFPEGIENQKLDAEEEKTNKDSLTTQAFDCQGKRTNRSSSATQSLGKRRAENVDLASAVKKQALEAGTGSPKSSSPTRTFGLSREPSLKSLDKGKVKHQTSFGIHSGNDTSGIAGSSTIAPRVQPQGSLSKSNSFSAFNSKPKVKLGDEHVQTKPKGAREHSYLDIKDGPPRMLGKSLSFKPSHAGRPNATESKVKILPSISLPVQDSKGIKQKKDGNIFDRKIVSKLDRSRVSSITTDSVVSTPKVDQKTTLRDDTNSLSSVSNNRDAKLVQSDGISNYLPKSTRSLANKGLDISVTSVGDPIIPKEETLSSSYNARKPCSFDNGPSWSREKTIHDEKNLDSSVCQIKRSVPTVSKSCQKCKKSGHASEFCTTGNMDISGSDATAARSSRESSDKGNKLKAAIQAAMLRRPEIYRKRRVLDQSDEISSSSTDLNGETASQDRGSVSEKLKNGLSAEETNEGLTIGCNSIDDGDKRMSNQKQLSVTSTDVLFPFKIVESDSITNRVEKLVLRDRDLRIHASSAISNILKMSTIPEHEYIWQGSFEVNRSGNLSVLHEGIQAHLSTSASPKVLEVVDKFPRNVILNEVPRLSTWPAQFHEHGTKEDNIALYFFAKDIESYERTYKILLGNMIANDLALKANLDGVELLIFPSNKLPDKSQRWNTLLFLWGVFRGRRPNCSDVSKKIHIPSLNTVPQNKDISTALVTSSDNVCLPKHVNMEFSARARPCNIALPSSPPNQTYDTRNSKCHNQDSSLQQAHIGSQANSGRRDSLGESNIPSMVATSDALFGQDRACSGHLDLSPSDHRSLDEELKPPTQITAKDRRAISSEVQFRSDSCGIENTSSLQTSKDEETIFLQTSKDEETILKERNGSTAVKSSSNTFTTAETVDSWETTSRKRKYSDLSDMAPSTSSASEQMPRHEAIVMRTDEYSVNGKPRTMFGPSLSVPEKRCTEVCDEKVIKEDLGKTERYFFPVGSLNVNDTQLGVNTVSWNTHSTEEDERLPVVPNLELALGAETKPPPSKGLLPFLVGLVDEKHHPNKPSDKVTTDKEDDPESLSLSLSFPFPDKEQAVKAVSKTEQLLADRLLLFGRLSEK